jgi:YbgC/YbaW family acyl-CoA thioester hydrolase
MNSTQGYPNTTQVSHCLEFTTSETEVDALGHLNNGVYIANLERARIAFYQHINLELESPPPKGLGTVVVNMNINFRLECFAGDRLQILTQAHSRGGRSYILSQTITRNNNEVVCDALVTNVVMDLNSRSVVEIPPALERIYQT